VVCELSRCRLVQAVGAHPGDWVKVGLGPFGTMILRYVGYMDTPYGRDCIVVSPDDTGWELAPHDHLGDPRSHRFDGALCWSVQTVYKARCEDLAVAQMEQEVSL
jgi:hypothetical protein